MFIVSLLTVGLIIYTFADVRKKWWPLDPMSDMIYVEPHLWKGVSITTKFWPKHFVYIILVEKTELERSNSEDIHEHFTLPETNIAPESLGLEDVSFLWEGQFSEAMLVSRRVHAFQSHVQSNVNYYCDILHAYAPYKDLSSSTFSSNDNIPG